MKVIKAGVLPGAWQKELICVGDYSSGSIKPFLGCRAVLLVDFTDLETGYWGSGMDDTNVRYVKFTCPQCKRETLVKDFPNNEIKNIGKK